MSKRIMTVCGEILPEQLGFCHSHEHLCILEGESAKINPALCIDDEACSARELELFRDAGGSSIVDAQPVGCGRDAKFLARISRKSGVAIIASTGFHKLQFYPQGHWIFHADEQQMSDLFESELCVGMLQPCEFAATSQRTAHRAGQIKTAWDLCGMANGYALLFRAAAHVARKTTAPLMVHIEQGADPIVLADFLEREQVAPERVIFCHMDRAVGDLSIHKELCQRGISMEYDTIARPKYHSDEKETQILLEMLDAGFEDQILMGLDVTRARLKSYGGQPGLVDIITRFIPLVQEKGVREQTIEKIFRANPARLFAW